ncbi:MAG TPA: hypothetical protein VMD59_19190 [Acidimicrobiales bacterium]|nr:hypothetical protein [Acidimicrobiales bacterium]
MATSAGSAVASLKPRSTSGLYGQPIGSVRARPPAVGEETVDDLFDEVVLVTHAAKERDR